MSVCDPGELNFDEDKLKAADGDQTEEDNR